MICKKCGKEFILNGKQGGQNRMFCYDCLPTCSDRALRNKMRRDLVKEFSDELKLKRGCDICGYNKCAQALEWHHPNNDKDDDPSCLLKTSFSAYLDEIEKCQLLCSNCHRELHSKDKK